VKSIIAVIGDNRCGFYQGTLRLVLFSSLKLVALLMVQALFMLYRLRCQFPDIPVVFANRSIGREFTAVGTNWLMGMS
jgi:hypothetical protein